MGTTSWIVRTKSRCKTYFDRKTISKLTISFTMMKFLAMFCLFIALFNEMEAKPIRLIRKAQSPANLQDKTIMMMMKTQGKTKILLLKRQRKKKRMKTREKRKKEKRKKKYKRKKKRMKTRETTK